MNGTGIIAVIDMLGATIQQLQARVEELERELTAKTLSEIERTNGSSSVGRQATPAEVVMPT